MPTSFGVPHACLEKETWRRAKRKDGLDKPAIYEDISMSSGKSLFDRVTF